MDLQTEELTSEGAHNRNKERTISKRAIAVLIEIDFLIYLFLI